MTNTKSAYAVCVNSFKRSLSACTFSPSLVSYEHWALGILYCFYAPVPHLLPSIPVFVDFINQNSQMIDFLICKKNYQCRVILCSYSAHITFSWSLMDSCRNGLSKAKKNQCYMIAVYLSLPIFWQVEPSAIRTFSCETYSQFWFWRKTPSLLLKLIFHFPFWQI